MSYDPAETFAAVQRGLDLIGAGGLFSGGEKILLKPNILNGSDPRRCVVTHPRVFGAVARALSPTGVTMTYGDSPCVEKCAEAARKAGFAAEAEALGIPLADFDTGEQKVFSRAKRHGRFPVAAGVSSADGVVSICKLKTHNFTRLTGAVKNQYGCVPGLTKAQFHTRFPLPADFAAFIVDISAYIAARLYIMDAVMAMEGDGPNNGDPRALGLLLFSTDPVALDAIACRVIDLDPRHVPTCTAGQSAGLGVWESDLIDVVGEPVSACCTPDFRVMRKPPFAVYSHGLRRVFQRLLSPRPSIRTRRCTRCGRCIRICPVTPKALAWPRKSGGAPRHMMDRCISCFCCQEACPSEAVSIMRPLVGRVLYASMRVLFPAARAVLHGMRRLRPKTGSVAPNA